MCHFEIGDILSTMMLFNAFFLSICFFNRNAK